MADEELEVPERGYNTQDVRAQREEERRPRRGRRWLWTMLGVLVLGPTLVFGLWALITLNYTYSRGERVGYVRKFSEKGWLCKTWEGELEMTNVPSLTVPERFVFTVRDDRVAETVRRLYSTHDGRIVLEYEQHKGVPSSCFGETDYFVTGARAVGPSGGGPAGTTAGAPAAGTLPAGTPAPATPGQTVPQAPARTP